MPSFTYYACFVVVMAVVVAWPSVKYAPQGQPTLPWRLDVSHHANGDPVLPPLGRLIAGDYGDIHVWESHADAAEKGVVVLVHGFSGDVRMWSNTVQQLNALGYRTVAFDTYGHGHSSAPSGVSYGVELMMSELSNVVLSMNLKPNEKIHLVGYSMGAVTVGNWAHRHHERVKSLVLACGAGIATRFPLVARFALVPVLADIAYPIIGATALTNNVNKQFNQTKEGRQLCEVAKASKMYQVQHNAAYLRSLLSIVRDFPLQRGNREAIQWLASESNRDHMVEPAPNREWMSINAPLAKQYMLSGGHYVWLENASAFTDWLSKVVQMD